MKKVLMPLMLFVSVIAVTAATTVLINRRNSTSTHSAQVINTMPQAGSHFTSYDRDKYPDLTYAAENAVQGVVNIEKIEKVQSSSSSSRSYDPFFEFFGVPQGSYQQSPQSSERRSGGSGVIISTDGFIVTNNHVVENASELKVTLNDRRTFSARIIGTDPTTDVALIKIEAEDLPTVPFGNSDELRLGEWVLAIGSPFDLSNTVTAGIISAKARNLDVIPNQFRIESFLQTDAAVNPGNSGGALVNVKGELVGINTVIKSPTGSYTGYSFAVPEAIVKKVVVDLKEYGVVQRAMLGVAFREIDDTFIDQMGDKTGISEKEGIYVATVSEGGAAQAAGIQEGDVITEIDGVKIESTGALLEIIAKHRPNDNVKVSVKRSGKVKQFDVTLRNRSGNTEIVTSETVNFVDALGGNFANLSEKKAKSLNIKGGVVVTSVDANGLLAKARIRSGYIITHINGKQIDSLSELSLLSGKIQHIEGVYQDGRAMSYSIVGE
ncbi:MAG: Do family serine endopeptidase [Rikenellaceae bacterium]